MWRDVTETIGEKERAGTLARPLEGLIQQALQLGRLLRIPGAAEGRNVDRLHGSTATYMKQSGVLFPVAGWRSPHAGNRHAAIGALAAGRYSVSSHPESAALNQHAGAPWAARVFQTRGLTGQVPGVDVVETRRAPDPRRANQRLRRRVVGSRHLVIPVERRDVPGNVRGDAGQESRHGLQLRIRVVEAGNHQGYDFQPKAHLVDAADGVENRPDPASQFVVAPVVEAFQIHFVQVNPWADI